MIVEMCMSRDVETIPPEASLFEGIRRMTERRIRRLGVAHVLGPGTTTLIDRPWNSGRAVVNVLRNTP